MTPRAKGEAGYLSSAEHTAKHSSTAQHGGEQKGGALPVRRREPAAAPPVFYRGRAVSAAGHPVHGEPTADKGRAWLVWPAFVINHVALHLIAYSCNCRCVWSTLQPRTQTLPSREPILATTVSDAEMLAHPPDLSDWGRFCSNWLGCGSGLTQQSRPFALLRNPSPTHLKKHMVR